MKRDRKPDNRHTCTNLTVTATIDEMMFLEELVKHLADGRSTSGNLQGMQPGWLTIDTSSIEAYVSGNMIVSDAGDPLRIPYTTCFLFTCIKERTGGYTLEGSFSLS